MILLDTDHLSELQRRDSRRGIKLRERLEKRGDRPIATSIISIEEQLRGRLAVINENRVGNKQVLAYTRLAELLDSYSSWIIVRFDHMSGSYPCSTSHEPHSSASVFFWPGLARFFQPPCEQSLR
jgi:predicted nucleic acid-binding protein